MLNDAVSIRVAQRKIQPKMLGLPIPAWSYILCNGNYSYPDKTGQGCEGEFSPLECLTNLLVNAELNRKGRPLGPIHATFGLIECDSSYMQSMEKILEIYARSEQTTVTFEYKK